MHRYRGNTHTHTLNSAAIDAGRRPAGHPEHGYRFLVLSDHNF
jgi:hypothetical protein